MNLIPWWGGPGMRPWLKWTLRVLAALIVIGAGGYWYLLMESGSPQYAYKIDMDEVRRLAASTPGDRPSDIRVEQVAVLFPPAVAITAGDGWETVPMEVYAYQLVYPDGATAIVDTAMSRPDAEDMGAGIFDDAAYARMIAAMSAARLIIVTHEHQDHIGGLLAHPDAKELMQRTILNPEQARDTTGAAPITFPPGALEGYTPVAYQSYRAIAPGIVLIRSPGHTPGSQIVYVQTGAGREYLFIGDIAWKRRNIDLVRERARLISLLLDERRPKVLDQLAELQRLAAAEPKLIIVPGHDGQEVAGLLASGALIQGFSRQPAGNPTQ
jgi:glyoxylase-like metal-dependent hydrolase (beta-lactamase superfamily II)